MPLQYRITAVSCFSFTDVQVILKYDASPEAVSLTLYILYLDNWLPIVTDLSPTSGAARPRPRNETSLNTLKSSHNIFLPSTQLSRRRKSSNITNNIFILPLLILPIPLLTPSTKLPFLPRLTPPCFTVYPALQLRSVQTMAPKISTRISIRWLPSTENPTEPTDTIVFGAGAYFIDLRVLKSNNSIDWALAGERQVVSTDPCKYLFPLPIEQHAKNL